MSVIYRIGEGKRGAAEAKRRRGDKNTRRQKEEEEKDVSTYRMNLKVY